VPELPEVETIRRQLAPAVEGRRLERIRVLDPRWCEPAPPEAIADALNGRVVERLGRRGKYLVMSLEDDVHLVMHLRMTGNILLTGEEPKHTRVRMELDGGRKLLFVDVRRFGTGDVLLGSDALAEYFASRLGVEPLSPDFTAEALRDQARGRRQPVKAFLLNQERIAGVGNIYADEALWRARLHPLRPADTLDERDVRRLHRAVRQVLREGIANRGASFSDYVSADGEPGDNAERLAVYRRTEQPCYRCGRRIERIVVGQRSTHFCPRCQRAPLGSDAA
jgi:formamidopyrimidine-DNA glycosylase